ncbi:MAG: hypothetical protein E7504_00855 [Ruminococcus sp.]|nr:hypothetical protein [Ruminococcus sp.]
MDIGIIAIAVMAVLGVIMFLAPKLCTRSDKRDDPDAVLQVKKCGIAVIACAIGAVLYWLKFKLR